MLNQFLLENIRFGLSLFCALIFFAASWLYFDAWLTARQKKELFRFLGYFLLSISFLSSATLVDSDVLSLPAKLKFLSDLILVLSLLSRFFGYIFLIISLQIDPFPIIPKTQPLEESNFLVLPAFFGQIKLPLIIISYPFFALTAGFLYFRRATLGLERHLKPVSFSFFILFLSELCAIGSLFRNTDNVDLYNFVAPYGLLWIMRYVLLLLAAVLLGRWVFVYLFKRFFTQLFMIFTSSVVTIYLVTAITFTWLLLNNIRDETFRRLETDIGVLNYAIDAKKSQSISDSELIAQNTPVAETLDKRQDLLGILEGFLLSKDQSFVWVVDKEGVVVARAEDPERFGDSVADDQLFLSAVSGSPVSSLVLKNGAISPSVSIRSSYPIKNKKGEISGVVLTGNILDNAFVDGIKKSTGLDASVYGENILSATTLVNYDGSTRPLGVREENETVKSKVLGEASVYTGETSVLNIPYLAGYLPLTDIQEKPIGMLFVGNPQSGVLEVASASIQLTFISTVILLVLSLIPSYFVARTISRQVQ